MKMITRASYFYSNNNWSNSCSESCFWSGSWSWSWSGPYSWSWSQSWSWSWSNSWSRHRPCFRSL